MWAKRASSKNRSCAAHSAVHCSAFRPPQREIALPLTIVFPILNGQIMGERLYFDLATLARQLDVSLDKVNPEL